jgi:CIC family chloride channel protein
MAIVILVIVEKWVELSMKKLQKKIVTLKTRDFHGRTNPIYMVLLSLLVGIMAGLGAVIFRALIAFIHNLLFLGQISLSYDANVHTPASYLGPLVIIIPVLGAAGVAFLVKNFAPEAKGHGVPEVIDAIYYKQGKIRPIVAIIKSLASALSIGSGGSIGREGPIIQIGSSIGSTLGQFINLSAWQRITLIASGAGAGIAATFNTPVGGVLFAVELITHEISTRTIVPISLATAAGTYIGRLFFGNHPSFIIPAFETPYFEVTQSQALVLYIGLGILAGLVSAPFLRSIYWMEDFFEKHIKASYYVRHMGGMLIVGVMMYLLFVFSGQYYIEGVGYSTVQDILMGVLSNPILLIVLFLLKILSTSLTLGSGASGGIFSPSLFVGATLGGLYGVVIHFIFPNIQASPQAFAVVGMAAIVGGMTGAAMTAIVMIFEMTLDLSVLLPLILAVAISFEVRKLLSPESVYTMKLVRRGHLIPEDFRKNFQDFLRADQIMKTPVSIISSTTPANKIIEAISENPNPPNYVITDGDQIIGIIEQNTDMTSHKHLPEDVPISKFLHTKFVNRSFILIDGEMPYWDILRKTYLMGITNAVVLDQVKDSQTKRIIGIISQTDIIGLVEDNEALF